MNRNDAIEAINTFVEERGYGFQREAWQTLTAELAQQHLTQQGSEPSEICHCQEGADWLIYRKKFLQGYKFDYCPACGKLLPC